MQLVIPDDDNELNDAAYSPAGCVSVNMPRSSYDFIKDPVAVLQAAIPYLTAANPQVATLANADIAVLLDPPPLVPTVLPVGIPTRGAGVISL
jgi:hypothetical protein